jgi:prepilin-type N-terminal cleavage/methylation domain-containing protein
MGDVKGMRLTRIAARVKRSPRSGFTSGQKGQTLVEVLVVVAILGIASVAFLSGITWSYHVAVLHGQKTMAESLTRSELERVRFAPYPVSDNTTTTALGYTVAVDAEYVQPVRVLPSDNETRYDPDPTGSYGMQLVTVTVSHQTKTLLVTTTNKVNR